MPNSAATRNSWVMTRPESIFTRPGDCMICHYCNKEMSDRGPASADTCKEPLDSSVAAGDRRCGDCGVAPGGTHHLGCGVERCYCGEQAISCGCGDNNRWTGLWPGVAECRQLGLYCRDLIDGVPVTDTMEVIRAREAGKKVEWHVPCEATDVGAHEDLNRLARREPH